MLSQPFRDDNDAINSVPLSSLVILIKFSINSVRDALQYYVHVYFILGPGFNCFKLVQPVIVTEN